MIEDDPQSPPETTVQVPHEAYKLRLLCSWKVRQLRSVDGRRSKVVDVAMDATRLKVDHELQQSMMGNVSEEVVPMQMSR